MDPPGPLIPGSVSNASNYTRLLRCGEILVTSTLTDSVATLSEGAVTGLIFPTAPNQAATLQYLSNTLLTNPIRISGADGSIQFNDGGGGLASSPNLQWYPAVGGGDTPSLNVNSTLIVNGTANGSLSTTGYLLLQNQSIRYLGQPIADSDSAVRGYIPNLAVSSLVTASTATSTTLTQTLVVNSLLNRTISAPLSAGNGTYQDVMPTYATVTAGLYSPTFYFIYRYVSGPPSITLFCGPDGLSSFLLRGTYYPKNIALNCLMVPLGAVLVIRAEYDTSGIVYNVISAQTIYPGGMETVSSGGLVTTNFNVLYGPTKTSLIVQPLNVTVVDTAGSYSYTLTDIKGLLVQRILTADTSDTFEAAATILADSTFSMGYGAVKFCIQNLSASATLTVNVAGSTGWTGSNVIIPGGSNGLFYIRFSSGGITLYSLGVHSRT